LKCSFVSRSIRNDLAAAEIAIAVTASISGSSYTQGFAHQPAALRHFDLAYDLNGSGATKLTLGIGHNETALILIADMPRDMDFCCNGP
jgi:hypothetical protein